MEVIRAALPHLRKQGGGRILQVTSMGGQISLPALSVYHATKWGIEGFVESVIPEVAPFNIGITMVEPSGASTNFAGSSLINATPMEAYDDTPAAAWRKAVHSSGEYNPTLDPHKAVDAMIASADESPAPKRLALGSQAYTLIHQALTERLASLEASKEFMFSNDYDKA